MAKYSKDELNRLCSKYEISTRRIERVESIFAPRNLPFTRLIETVDKYRNSTPLNEVAFLVESSCFCVEKWVDIPDDELEYEIDQIKSEELDNQLDTIRSLLDDLDPAQAKKLLEEYK